MTAEQWDRLLNIFEIVPETMIRLQALLSIVLGFMDGVEFLLSIIKKDIMKMRKVFVVFLVAVFLLAIACKRESKERNEMKNSVENQFQGDNGEVVLITLDPGHFHASLVQKVMYPQIDPTVYVFGPEGPDIKDHLNRLESFNNRDNEPTRWNEIVYTGKDYFDKMLVQKPGNVVVISGNNKIKADYILRSVKAGFNVLADKPMIIYPEDFPKLEQAFKVAE
ncbi:unnamed protein product, partial [marine sediment metagenome]